MTTTLFGRELSPMAAILVYGFLAAALLLLCWSIWYYWSYARKIERFLARDNAHNNMRRDELVDSFQERGEEEWPCAICFHNNHPSKTTCVLCGTPQMLNSRSPSIARASGISRLDMLRQNHSILTQQSRVRSFQIRRLKQMDLSTRQKAAMRRLIWKRAKGTDGQLHWVRIDATGQDGYRELATPRTRSTPTAALTDDDDGLTDSMRQENLHVALALREFGEDDQESLASSQNSRYRSMSEAPLRSTALKNLEEAEERMSTCFQALPNPYNNMGAQLRQRDLTTLEEGDDDEVGDLDRNLGRDDNGTAISTGYVRRETEDGGCEWMPAQGVALPEIVRANMECDDDLEEIAALTFHEKNRWFLQQVQKRWRSYDQGHIQFVVRREFLVEDSMEQMLKCPASRFWERLRIYFENEPGLDAGGLLREWFECLCDSLFKDSFGLFIATKGENMGYWINPASAAKVPNHLKYYEFVGRLLAKALIEGHNLKMSLALPLIKHILGVPISFSDLEFLDEDLYKNAKWMKQNEQAELLNLDFTVQVITSEGKSETVDLVRDGRSRSVTDDNKQEYLDLLLKHYMFQSISDQLSALLKGFFDVVPMWLITVFDYQEFDLLLSGIPHIDVDDWRTYSEVRWLKLERPSVAEQRVLGWFWDTIGSFTSEESARLLQFTTGTSRVPVQGFKALTSSDGRVRRFTIQFVQRGQPPTGLMPKGHTCFNRIDLPLYQSADELVKYLTLVINMEITGFWLE